MVLFFYGALNGVVILILAKQKSKPHPLEILSYWMLSSYVIQNYSAFSIMNFKTLAVPEMMTYELAHWLNRVVLYPVLTVIFLHLYLALNTFTRKLWLMVGFVLLFVGVEWLADLLHVQSHVHWRVWWSFAFWFGLLLISIAFMKFFRKLLYKGALMNARRF